jgi:hypothetical protein
LSYCCAKFQDIVNEILVKANIEKDRIKSDISQVDNDQLLAVTVLFGALDKINVYEIYQDYDARTDDKQFIKDHIRVLLDKIHSMAFTADSAVKMMLERMFTRPLFDIRFNDIAPLLAQINSLTLNVEQNIWSGNFAQVRVLVESVFVLCQHVRRLDTPTFPRLPD